MLTEQEARNSETCPACDEPKGQELLVCWQCFKYRTDKTPFKYYEGKDDLNPLQEWLDYLDDGR